MGDNAKDESVDNGKNEEKLSAEENFISLMRSKLPQYIVNCFITTGYDTIEVMREINDQKLNDIEEFINKHFPKNVKYIHPDFDKCMFPPGHRMRIIQVVKEICSVSLIRLGKHKAVLASKPPKKVGKLSEDIDDEDTKLTLKECYTKVRNQIVKWQRKEQNKIVQRLTENHDYEIQISYSGSEPSISIMCKKCNKKCALGLKGQSVLLSNWKRHVSSCIVKKHATQSILKGTQLHNFFKVASSCQVQGSKPDDDHQNFQKAPPVVENGTDIQTIGNTGGAVVDIHVDWSRKSRNTLKLLESGEIFGQTKLTDYYEVVDRIDMVIKENYNFIEQSELKFNVEQNNVTNFHSFFRELLRNAEKNCSKIPTQRRHDNLIKQFATALFVYSGPVAYNFIHKNIPECLPSLRTVQRLVHSTYTFHMEGVFQFKGLEEHLHLYNAKKIISISEDATRLIGRVDYDKETDKLVGFVLPSNNEGIPLSDSFIAVSFDFVKETFLTTEIGKYVLVYMAQPLEENVPAYCLMCATTDNRYNAELITKRWKYIYDECLKRGIQVISYGADGDSKQLRSMKLSTGLFNKSPANKKTLVQISSGLKIPEKWKSWFLLQNPTSIAYVQDTIHLAVKLKARLMKTSIILPFGNFVAGIHHLRIVQQAYGKDQHGLREKDLNPIDRQNFDAVTHITSTSTMQILETIPDARGTQLFLDMIKHVVDSYLRKNSCPLECIRHAWYAVYFCRYWRYWLLHNPNYTLKNNFITSNAYCCIELNAHALIIFLMTLRDSDLKCDKNFFPCLLGSQPCEKAFRAMRSMSGIFSTVINFSMLGFLRKLHRMHIQLKLEGEMTQSGVLFPQSNKHGQTDDTMKFNISSISNEDILETIKQAKVEAQEAMKKLGMADTFKHNGNWINPCNKKSDEIDDDSSEEDSDSELDMENIHENKIDAEKNNDNNGFLKHTLTVEDTTQLCADINNLKAEGININDKVASQLNSELQNVCEVTNTHDNQSPAEKKVVAHSKKTHDTFFEITIKEKAFKIQKVTAVWLLQEGEKVSSDRLFRVRSKQPYNNISTLTKSYETSSSGVPHISEVLCVGDFCAFMIDHDSANHMWKIGKVLQFSQYKEKLHGKQQYFSKHVLIKENFHKIGVLCTWYNIKDDKSNSESTNVEFFLSCSYTSTNEKHYYHPLSYYICTIPPSCFINGSKFTNFVSVLDINQDIAIANCISTLVLTQDIVAQINHFIPEKLPEKEPTTLAVQKQLRNKKEWMKIGSYTLTTAHKEAIIKSQELDDMHMNAAQLLLKQSFPQLGGLQNVLLNTKTPLENSETGLVQILHVNNNHWAALSYFNKSICYYDSSYSTLSPETKQVIANLFHSQCNGSKLNIHIKDVTHQSGIVDCGLYAIAYITSVAYGNDPSALVFCQEMLRSHFIKCLQQKLLTEFPVKQKRRPRPPKLYEIFLYCSCRMPDDGEKMVFCEQCDEWYHAKCLGSVGKVPEDLKCNCGTVLSITE